MKIIFIVVLLFFTFTLFADKTVNIELTNGTQFSGNLLFGTDSLLYIWSGLSDFDPEQLQFVQAIPYFDIVKINLSSGLTWSQSLKRVLPVSAAAGIVLTSASDGKSSFSEDLFQAGFYTVIFTIPAGTLFYIGSNIFTRSISNPESSDFNINDGKYRKKMILKKDDEMIINKIMLEVNS